MPCRCVPVLPLLGGVLGSQDATVSTVEQGIIRQVIVFVWVPLSETAEKDCVTYRAKKPEVSVVRVPEPRDRHA